MIGKTVSHYKILEKLGEGGMGEVYRAQDTKLDRIVALKFLPHYLASDLSEKERFLHEARAASVLNHTNITTIYEIDEYDGEVYIAMEYVEGKTLKQLIENETLSLKKILDMAIQIGEGLVAAVEKGVIHRDIKSDNIMVTPRGQVKIMDFGLAKFRGATKLTKVGSTLGTAAYMSPEQASGEEVDHRTDIFSFGVVLYEMLTTRLPFEGEHQAAIIYSILNEEPQPIVRYNNKVSPDLERIVFKALSKEKEDRYQHIEDLQVDLRHEKKNLEYVKTAHLPIAEAASRPKKQLLKYLVPTSAVLIIAFLLLILKPFKLEVGPEQKAVAAENSLAVMYFENIQDQEDKDHTGEMLTNLLTTSLSQVKGLEVISRERLYDIQKELGQTETRSITSFQASQIAKRAGVKTMLLGTILQKQPKLAITSRLIDAASGKILKSQRITGFSVDQIFSLVDSLAILVKNDLNLTPASIIETKSVAEVTTGSPEAYRSYLEGVELAKKLYYAEAEAVLRRAVELDSNFAMAYFRLAEVSRDDASRKKALQKAWQLSNKVTERERLRIQSLYVNTIDNDPAGAAEILEKLLQKYPHEQSAYDQLANVYQTLLEYEKAQQTFLAGLKSDSLDKILWNDLAYIYAGFKERQKALEAVDRYLKLAPGEPNPYDSKGEIYFIFGEIDSALYWYNKAASIRSDFVTTEKLGYNALLRQDYSAAEKYFQQLGSTSDKYQKALAEIDFVIISMYQGKFKKAQNQVLNSLSSHMSQKLQQLISWDYSLLTIIACETEDYSAMLDYAKKLSAELKKDPSNIFYGRSVLAWAYIKNGQPQKAYQIMNELRKDIGRKSPIRQVIYDIESALLAYEEGKYELALEKFAKAFQPLLPNRGPQFYYAVTLLKTGNLSQAINELQRLTWWSSISAAPIMLSSSAAYWSIASVKAHYWLGVAYEQKGENEKAIQEYETFIQIWKDADSEIQAKEIKDAKERLEKLKTKTT